MKVVRLAAEEVAAAKKSSDFAEFGNLKRTAEIAVRVAIIVASVQSAASVGASEALWRAYHRV